MNLANVYYFASTKARPPEIAIVALRYDRHEVPWISKPRATGGEPPQLPKKCVDFPSIFAENPASQPVGS